MAAKSRSEERGTWSGKLDFTFSALSFAVGMGNLWRFPYLCYRNGGGAFLIPYIISMILAGYPLMLLELALGQFAGKGIVAVWKSCPLFEGIGWGMFSVSVFTGLYYNMIVAWCFFYMFASFGADVPWRDCDNPWNTPNCITGEMRAAERRCATDNGTWINSTCQTGADSWLPLPFVNATAAHNSDGKSPEDEFFNNYMLDVSEGFHQPGLVRWQLALCFLLCWLIVFLALAKGIKVSGKVTYVTALFPYVVLFILLIRGLTLEGSVSGILYYVTPQWDRLLSARVWGDAAIQAFFSLSICWGGLISLASYNKFNNDCVRDAIVVATGDMMTSIFGGFVIFSFIGYMAHDMGLPIEEVATQGPGLAFIVYPEAVTKLPISPLWSVLFMLMLINIGIGSQMGLLSTIHTTLLDQFEERFGGGRRPLILLGVLCLIGFLFGLLLCTRGGIYFLLLMDSYSATYALLMLALAECFAIGWVYGTEAFYKDLEMMLGRRVSIWWQICWRFIDPALIVFITVFIFLDFTRSSYRDYVFPIHWEIIGWGIAAISMLMVPIVAIGKILSHSEKGTIAQRVRHLVKPDPGWGPASDEFNHQSEKGSPDEIEKMETNRV